MTQLPATYLRLGMLHLTGPELTALETLLRAAGSKPALPLDKAQTGTLALSERN